MNDKLPQLTPFLQNIWHVLFVCVWTLNNLDSSSDANFGDSLHNFFHACAQTSRNNWQVFTWNDDGSSRTGGKFLIWFRLNVSRVTLHIHIKWQIFPSKDSEIEFSERKRKRSQSLVDIPLSESASNSEDEYFYADEIDLESKALI